MNIKPIKKILTGAGTQKKLYAAFVPVLLMIFLGALFIAMVSVCFTSTKGPLSTTAFLKQLQSLQARFAAGKIINPETEREHLEKLQNKVKTLSEASIISGNADLRRLLHSICQSIKIVLDQPDLANRTTWIKLNSLMVDFNTQYFSGNT